MRALAVTSAALLSAKTVADPDLWGHLQFGLDALHARRVTIPDVYSYLTAGAPGIHHEWGTEVLLAVAWTLGGERGLIGLKMVVGLVLIGFLFRHLKTPRLREVDTAVLLLLFGSGVFLPFFFLLRGQIFTYLFFAFTLAIITRAEDGDHRWLWAAPPLVMVWANIHGGVLAGLCLFCGWAAMHAARHRRAALQVLLPAAAAVAAIAINPYGTGLLTFLLRTATVPRPEISDWQPLQIASIFGALYIVVLAASASALVLTSKPRNPVLMILFGISTLLPLLAVRHLPLFYIASVMLVGPHAEDAWLRLVPHRVAASARPGWAWLLPAATTAIILIIGVRVQIHRIPMHAADFPVASVALLKQSGVAGNLAVEFSWGEYVIWHLGPRVKVSMDGRRETIYTPEVYKQNLDFMFGRDDWSALLTRQATDMALVTRGAADYNLLSLHQEWVQVFADAGTALFVRRASAVAGPLRHAAAGFVPPQPPNHFP
jgi:hypothetical protein